MGSPNFIMLQIVERVWSQFPVERTTCKLWCEWENCRKKAGIGRRGAGSRQRTHVAPTSTQTCSPQTPDTGRSRFWPGRRFELDEKQFSKNFRSFRRGAAAGPSGVTAEHLRLLLYAPRILHLMFQASESLAAAHVLKLGGSRLCKVALDVSVLPTLEALWWIPN